MLPSRLAAQAQPAVVSQVMAMGLRYSREAQALTRRLALPGRPTGPSAHIGTGCLRCLMLPPAVEDRAHVEHADFTSGKAAFQFVLRFFTTGALVAFGTTITPSSSALTMSPGLDGNLATG